MKKRYAKHNRLLSKKKTTAEDPNSVVEGVAPAQNVGMALRPVDTASVQASSVVLRPAGVVGTAEASP